MTFVTRNNGQLFYQVFGSGKETLLAYHGFGQDKGIFMEWANILGDKYRIIAFDLFYHGSSSRENEKLSKRDWQEWLALVLDKEAVSEFSILGYSLGGRFALATALGFPHLTIELTLIAPDGVFLTPWFKLATTPGVKLAFKYFMMHPDKLEKLLALNERSRILNRYVVDFVRKELGDEENRRRVYASWNDFKTLGYSRRDLIRLFNKYTFKRHLIIGNKDHIIHPKNILPIINQMGSFKVDILPMKHHQLAKPEVAELLR